MKHGDLTRCNGNTHWGVHLESCGESANWTYIETCLEDYGRQVTDTGNSFFTEVSDCTVIPGVML